MGFWLLLRKLLFALALTSFISAHAQTCADLLAQLTPRKKPSLLSRTALGATATVGLLWGAETLARDPTTVFVDNPNTTQKISVAMVGDSLSTDFHLSGMPEIVWNMRNDRIGGWFNDIDPAPSSPLSLVERLATRWDVEATLEANVSSQVEGTNLPDFPAQRAVGRVNYYATQMENLARAERLPDLALIWVGHNNMDWIYSDADHVQTAEEIKSQSREIAQKTVAKILDLKKVFDAQAMHHPEQKMAVVVYAMADFHSFIEGRNQAEAIHRANAEAYPYFDTALETFPSISSVAEPGKEAPVFGIARLADATDLEIQTQISALGLENDPRFRVRFSDALKSVNFSNIQRLSVYDGWHPSEMGHSSLAGAAEADLETTLKWLKNE